MTVPLAPKARAALDVLRAMRAVTRARRVVRGLPVGQLVQTGAEAVTRTDHVDSGVGARWALAVDRGLRWLPGDSACLVRAHALRQLLQSDGVADAVVRIGVRRGAAGFEAHAWVELGGHPVAEPVTLQGGFASLDGVTLR